MVTVMLIRSVPTDAGSRRILFPTVDGKFAH